MKFCHSIFTLLTVIACLCSCNYSNEQNQEETHDDVLSPRAIASEHSSALTFFFNQAIEDGKTISIRPDTKSVNEKEISEEYIIQTLSNYLSVIPTDYCFQSTKNNLEYFDNSLLNQMYSDAIYFIVLQEHSFSSVDTLELAVKTYLDSIKDDYQLNYLDALSTSLFILIDSYNYWIEEDGFAIWITSFLSVEDQQLLANRYNISYSGSNNTKVSGAEMRAWSEMARENAKNGGFAATVIDDDASGFIAGLLLSRNVPAAVTSSAVGSIVSALKNFFAQ